MNEYEFLKNQVNDIIKEREERITKIISDLIIESDGHVFVQNINKAVEKIMKITQNNSIKD